jgi:hypothetical protein
VCFLVLLVSILVRHAACHPQSRCDGVFPCRELCAVEEQWMMTWPI